MLGLRSTPVVPANVRARATPPPVVLAGPGGDANWMTYASMTVAAASLGVAGFGLWRRRTDKGDD